MVSRFNANVRGGHRSPNRLEAPPETDAEVWGDERHRPLLPAGLRLRHVLGMFVTDRNTVIVTRPGASEG